MSKARGGQQAPHKREVANEAQIHDPLGMSRQGRTTAGNPRSMDKQVRVPGSLRPGDAGREPGARRAGDVSAGRGGWTLPPQALPPTRRGPWPCPNPPPTHLPVAVKREAELVRGARGASTARFLGSCGGHPGGGGLVVREGVGERPLLHFCLSTQMQLESL